MDLLGDKFPVAGRAAQQRRPTSPCPGLFIVRFCLIIKFKNLKNGQFGLIILAKNGFFSIF